MDLLDVSARAEAGFTIITVSGELDINTIHTAEQRILAAWAEHGPQLIFDLSGLSFMDSAGVTLLLRVHRNAYELEGSMALTGLTRSVRRILETAGLTKHLAIFATVEDAIARRPSNP